MAEQDELNTLFQKQFEALFEQLCEIQNENKRLYDENMVLANFIRDMLKKDSKNADTLKKILSDHQATLQKLDQRIDANADTLNIIIQNLKAHLLDCANYDDGEDLIDSDFVSKKNNKDN